MEDELDDPWSLALPDWPTLTTLADALVARSSDGFRGWGDVAIFAACTAARIGGVSGCRVDDINTVLRKIAGTGRSPRHSATCTPTLPQSRRPANR